MTKHTFLHKDAHKKCVKRKYFILIEDDLYEKSYQKYVSHHRPKLPEQHCGTQIFGA